MSDDAKAFDRLVDDFFRAWARFHPEAAVEVGLGDHAAQLAPLGDDDAGALLSLHAKLLSGLEEIDPARLDPARRIDYALSRGMGVIGYHELGDAEAPPPDPARFLPVEAIHQLAIRPVGNVAGALRARLETIPGRMRGARTALREAPEGVPAPWAERALAEARDAARFLRGLDRHPLVARWINEAGDIVRLGEEAAHAVDDYVRFLAEEITPRATGAWTCGPQHYRRLLYHRHGLDIEIATLRAALERLREPAREELRAAARALGDNDVAAARERLAEARPEGDDVLSLYRAHIQAARRAVEDDGLVSLPEREALRVTRTPPVLDRRYPAGVYYPPALHDPARRGYCYVTVSDDAASARRHDPWRVAVDATRLAWPGLHLQAVTARRSVTARGWPRMLWTSTTLSAGWPGYAGGLMRERGYLARPEHRFVLAEDWLRAVLEGLADIELHTGGLSLDAAVERLHGELALDREDLRRDLVGCTQAPTSAAGAAVGVALIRAARDVATGAGGTCGLRAFHDRVLAQGPVAAPLVIPQAVGDNAWRAARRAVLEPGG